MTLDEVVAGSYLESVVGHCQVEQEVPGIILGCFVNKFYTQKKKIIFQNTLKLFGTSTSMS